MHRPSSTWSPSEPPESQRVALVKLLTDEDPAIYRAVRKTILACGPAACEWLRPHGLSGDPVLRRRAQEIIDHFARQEADVRFLAFCLNHGEEFDLETGAWLLAETAYPHINREAYRALLEGYATDLRERIDFNDRAGQILGVINEYLFDELGFRGDARNYYDPENSYLNRVVDRRTGNPINLCLFYLLLARRLRLPLTGVGLPGHFICRYQSTADEVYLDVFNRGRLLTKADCIQHLAQGNHRLCEDFLSPMSARRMLLRICDNLHQIYLQLGLPAEATRTQRYLVALKG